MGRRSGGHLLGRTLLFTSELRFSIIHHRKRAANWSSRGSCTESWLLESGAVQGGVAATSSPVALQWPSQICMSDTSRDRASNPFPGRCPLASTPPYDFADTSKIRGNASSIEIPLGRGEKAFWIVIGYFYRKRWGCHSDSLRYQKTQCNKGRATGVSRFAGGGVFQSGH